MIWSGAVWDLKGQLGSTITDFLAMKGIYYRNGYASFLQEREGIIQADIDYYGGAHVGTIKHTFYLRGIGSDGLQLEGLVGQSNLAFKELGTWYPAIISGSGNYSYQWYASFDNGSTWTTLGTAQSQSYRMGLSDFIIRCDVHDNGTGDNASARMTVYYGSFPPVANGNDETGRVQEIPKEYFIGSYPNPFNPAAVINYQLPVDGVVRLTIFDVLGREIMTLANETKPAGYYKAAFDGSQLPSGIYLARISVIPNQGKSFVQTIKMVLTK